MYPTTLMASKPQIQKINILLRQMGIMEMKNSMVMQFSNDRTNHISELSKLEATNMIKYLVYHNPNEKQRAAIISLGYKTGLLYGDTPEDKKMNMVKLDRFLKERGAVKKPFKELLNDDLNKVRRQFEGMLKKNGETAANKATTNLLNELGLTVSK